MFRTRTTIVIGSGVGVEVEMPDGKEILNRISQGFDFSRLGSDLQSRDLIQMARHFRSASSQFGASEEALQAAGGAIRNAARLTPAIEAILEQYGHDPLVQVAGRLAILHYALQAEARSVLALAPREAGELPLRGTESWLFQLGRLLVNGVPRASAESCLDNLLVISFTPDRALEHFLPFVLEMAFGMALEEARQLVGEKLRIVHPFGRAGRLPWEAGEGPAAEWADETPANMLDLVADIRMPGELRRDRRFMQHLIGEVACSARLLFLGFGFEAQAMELMFDQPLGPYPEVMVTMPGADPAATAIVRRLLRHHTGIEDDRLIAIEDLRPWQLLRDYALVLES